jgi:hypothetical protein
MKTQPYSDLDQYLHNQFLGDTELSNFLFNRIKKYKKPKQKIQKVFISGLARAGTTALLNQLYITGQFASLKYSHMPFVLNPRLSFLFSKISDKNQEATERIHQDGIRISIDSPECLDEPFWIKENHKYFSQKISTKRKYKPFLLNCYANFLSKHCIFQNKEKILIKNNNNLLRLPQLCNFFKDDLFIVLFREPISHSVSLNNTHQKICEAQRKDPFILEYMNLIGHREFGLNQTPFHYQIKDDQKNSILNSREKLNYWIQSWINCYSWLYEYIKKNKPKNLLLISYEQLCETNSGILKNLFQKLELNDDYNFILSNKNKNIKNLVDIDKKLKSASKEIYLKLIQID